MREDKFSNLGKFLPILFSTLLSITFCQPDTLISEILGYSNSEKNSASRQRSYPFSISSSSKTVSWSVFLSSRALDASSSDKLTAFFAFSLLISLSRSSISPWFFWESFSFWEKLWDLILYPDSRVSCSFIRSSSFLFSSCSAFFNFSSVRHSVFLDFG